MSIGLISPWKQMPTNSLILQWYRKYLRYILGHSCVLQSSESKTGPSHWLPPKYGPIHCLVRNLVPPPHVTLQASHPVQSFQTPSTLKKITYQFFIYLTYIIVMNHELLATNTFCDYVEGWYIQKGMLETLNHKLLPTLDLLLTVRNGCFRNSCLFVSIFVTALHVQWTDALGSLPAIFFVITKTCLFKYIENYTPKNWKCFR